MKVGIITFHKAINYGAILQAFALQSAVKKLNSHIDVEIINYIPPKFVKVNQIIKLKSGKRMFLESVLIAPYFYKRKKIFENFSQKFLNLTKPLYNKEELKNFSRNYDYIITGSDQVWNYNLTNTDDAYFINFNERAIKVAYAASFGIEKIPSDLENWYTKLINKINFISTREQQGVKIVNELCNKKVPVVLDPTFLLDKDEWKLLIKEKIEKNYILIYTLNSTDILIKAAKKLKEETGMQIILLCYGAKYIYSKYSKYDISPEQFIALFMHANYILTDSFHGTAFSINFNKKFLVSYDSRKNNVNSRLQSILTLLGLQKQVINTADDINKIYTDIDYKKVNKLLKEERNKSFEFLKTSININE